MSLCAKLARCEPLKLGCGGSALVFCQSQRELGRPPEAQHVTMQVVTSGKGRKSFVDSPGPSHGLSSPEQFREHGAEVRRCLIQICVHASHNFAVYREPIILAGTPATFSFGRTWRVTTAPAPITAPSPIVTPFKMIAPAPIQTLFPIRTEPLTSGCWAVGPANSMPWSWSVM